MKKDDEKLGATELVRNTPALAFSDVIRTQQLIHTPS